jgi:uncharacterized membrane protein
MTDTLIAKADLAQKLTLAALFGLVVLFSAWFLVLIPPGHPLTILNIHIVPLLLFVPGLLKKKHKVFIWLCFVILLYFCQSVMNSFALPTTMGVIGIIQATLCVWLFCAAMMAARYYARLENSSI